MRDLLEGVRWYGGSSVRVELDGVVIYVDPRNVAGPADADYVLLTHPHYDNFSEQDIKRVRTARTAVVAPASMKKQLEDADHFLHPGDLIQLENIDLLAVPAHNTDKRFHPPQRAWLGYVFTIGGVTYFHAGDTDYLESIKDIRCDVAFLPCGGYYTMGPLDAARAARDCGARIVVPVHWGEPSSSDQEAQQLADMLPELVRILERSD